MSRAKWALLAASSAVTVMVACGDDSGSSGGASSSGNGAPTGGTPTTPATPTCAAAGGAATVSAPSVKGKLTDKDEGWLGSPAIVDLDGDGKAEIVAVRGGKVMAWHADGQQVWSFDTTQDRIWASPIVGNFTGDDKLEVAVAARDSAYLIDASGKILSGFPKKFGTAETRTVAAGDVDGDGALDLVVGVRNGSGDSSDIVNAYHANGTAVAGFPPVASGVSGCTPGPCYFAGLYDQNLAVGDLDGDGKHDLVLPHDNAYASFFKGTGVAFDSNPMFTKRTKVPGVRYLHNLEQAKQGYADDEDVENQAHFTNTPPAIADIDKDGTYEIVMVGSVQNASQSDRKRGVGLWVVGSDASRHAGWESPFHVQPYVMGLGDGFNPDLEGDAVKGADNLVGLTNQVTVADIDATKAGLEMIFAGYDGKIHAVAADKTELWATDYATNGRALTAGIVVADLSGDGSPEVVFTTYSPDQGGGALFVLSAKGEVLHKVALPKRGSMAAPTIGDADGDGELDIAVSMKDEGEGVVLYGIAGAKPNCVLWPTGRANYLRNGWVR